jgi:hypothetical protein
MSAFSATLRWIYVEKVSTAETLRLQRVRGAEISTLPISNAVLASNPQSG